MKDYKEIELSGGCTIEEAVKELTYYKNKGIKVFGEFNGHKLYSDTITIDSAYKQITGHTKEEYENKQKKIREEFQKQFEENREKAIKKIPFWIEKGCELFSEEKLACWKEIVPIKAKDLYHGFELDCILEIETVLNQNTPLSFIKAEKILKKQNHSGISYSIVCSMIKEFCTNSDEFLKYINKNTK